MRFMCVFVEQLTTLDFNWPDVHSLKFHGPLRVPRPETNYVRREYSVTAILLLLFMVLISLVSVLNLLYFYINTFRSMCAVPNNAAFCSSLTSSFPRMLITYYYYY
jgi:hypothetical protein